MMSNYWNTCCNTLKTNKKRTYFSCQCHYPADFLSRSSSFVTENLQQVISVFVQLTNEFGCQRKSCNTHELQVDLKKIKRTGCSSLETRHVTICIWTGIPAFAAIVEMFQPKMFKQLIPRRYGNVTHFTWPHSHICEQRENKNYQLCATSSGFQVDSLQHITCKIIIIYNNNINYKKGHVTQLFTYFFDRSCFCGNIYLTHMKVKNV